MVYSVLRNVSVPIGIKISGQSNVSDMLWLTASDQRHKVYVVRSRISKAGRSGQAQLVMTLHQSPRPDP
jgi:penicillin V acylase-like amidase (Ntn superfamily)